MIWSVGYQICVFTQKFENRTDNLYQMSWKKPTAGIILAAGESSRFGLTAVKIKKSDSFHKLNSLMLQSESNLNALRWV